MIDQMLIAVLQIRGYTCKNVHKSVIKDTISKANAICENDNPNQTCLWLGFEASAGENGEDTACAAASDEQNRHNE